MSNRRSIAIVGMPRSGTSWFAKLVSHAVGFSYFREPDNYDHVSEAKHLSEDFYLVPGSENPVLRCFFERVFEGEIATPFTLSQNPGPILSRFHRRLFRGIHWPKFLYRLQDNVLVKLVRSTLLLGWLAKEFPNTRFIYIVRHPCGQFLSWRKLGWTPNLERLTSHGLFTDELDTKISETSATGFFEVAGVYWGLMNQLASSWANQFENVRMVTHEQLCLDTFSVVNKIAEWCNIEMNDRFVQFVEKSSNSEANGAFSLVRNSSLEVSKWQNVLTSEEISQCRKYAEAFAHSPYLDFDPTKIAPSFCV